MSSPEMQQSVDVDVPQGVDGHSPSGDSPIPSGDSPIPSSDLLTSSSDSPIKILVVDDEVDLEALVLQKFRRQIRKGELAFSFAHNGKEAIEKLDEDPEIAMVLSDINMPVMDGLALLKQLSETKPEIRAVIVSAYGDMSNIRTAMNRGAFDFVTKPIDFGDLQITIDKTLKHLRLMKDALASRDQLVALNSELDVARQMQAAALPARCSSTDFYDFNAVMVPAKEVGGDFYDLIRMSEKRIGVAIGDVSGKGVPAALFTMATRTLLRSYAMGGDPPHQCLNKVNELLCEDNDMCMFVTLFYAVLDAENGVLHYCNGGHNLPRIVRNDGRVEVLHATRNVAARRGCRARVSARPNRTAGRRFAVPVHGWRHRSRGTECGRIRGDAARRIVGPRRWRQGREHHVTDPRRGGGVYPGHSAVRRHYLRDADAARRVARSRGSLN